VKMIIINNKEKRTKDFLEEKEKKVPYFRFLILETSNHET